MVVGNGMLAKAFSGFCDDDRVLIFASGVSNSLETDGGAFDREKSQLLKTRQAHSDKLFVYFGTCSVYDLDRRETPYVAHKLELEAVLEQSGMPWMVLRLPLAIGPGQSGQTLAPFLYQRISQGAPFEIWKDATRYPVDVADVLRIGRRFIDSCALWNRRINVALRAFPVLEFVRVMESILGKAAVYHLVPKGRHYVIHCPEVEAVARELDLDFSKGYLDRVLRKYFSAR